MNYYKYIAIFSINLMDLLDFTNNNTTTIQCINITISSLIYLCILNNDTTNSINSICMINTDIYSNYTNLNDSYICVCKYSIKNQYQYIECNSTFTENNDQHIYGPNMKNLSIILVSLIGLTILISILCIRKKDKYHTKYSDYIPI